MHILFPVLRGLQSVEHDEKIHAYTRIHNQAAAVLVGDDKVD